MNITGKRVSFANVQHSHGVAAKGYVPLPYRTGYEEVVGSRVDNLFVVTAEYDGVVTGVKPDSLLVEYRVDGEIKRMAYELGITHGVVSGSIVPHNRITDMHKGQTFHKGDALVFNSGFFTRSELNPSNVVYKAGVVSRVALFENSDTIEDGCVVSEKLASELNTVGTTLHGVVVDFNTAVHNLVKVGDIVEPETVLCSLELPMEGVVNSHDAEVIKSLNRLATNAPKAKVYGKITHIEVLYYGSIDDMHITLNNIASEYDALRSKNVRRFGQSNALTGKIDEVIRVSGKYVNPNQMVIKIYIDGDIPMTTGDKVVFGNALKSTCSRVSTDLIASKDGEEIDAIFGYQSISDRIVCSPEIQGLMNSVLIRLSKEMGKRYKKLAGRH